MQESTNHMFFKINLWEDKRLHVYRPIKWLWCHMFLNNFYNWIITEPIVSELLVNIIYIILWITKIIRKENLKYQRLVNPIQCGYGRPSLFKVLIPNTHSAKHINPNQHGIFSKSYRIKSTFLLIMYILLDINSYNLER